MTLVQNAMFENKCRQMLLLEVYFNNSLGLSPKRPLNGLLLFL